jgi:hypothetical protein
MGKVPVFFNCTKALPAAATGVGTVDVAGTVDAAGGGVPGAELAGAAGAAGAFAGDAAVVAGVSAGPGTIPSLGGLAEDKGTDVNPKEARRAAGI